MIEMMKYDVAIVGGGIAGLTAAIYAAKAGKKTIVLEQQKQLGGRAITNKKQGVYFDLGGHALYKGEAYETFQELGLHLKGSTPSIEGYGLWKNQLLTLPMGLGSMIQSPLLSWKGKLEYVKWLSKLLKADTSKWNHISIREWIETEIHDPMTRNLFYSFLRSITYVIAPDLHIAGPALQQLKRSLKGVLYADKGWGSFVEQLHEMAVNHGVNIQTGCKIASVQHSDQKVDSIFTADGSKIEATNVILTTPPAVTQKLVPHADQTAIAKWNKQSIPITAACLDVALKKLPKPKHQFIYGIDQPVFLTDQSRSGKPTPAYLSENGDHKISLLRYQGPQTNAEEDRKQLEQVLDLAQPGWRDELTSHQYLPKITVAYDFPHINRTIQPGPEVPEIKGLYVAGDWVSHGEILVDASVASARRAVEHMLHTQLLIA